jgi:LuxR family glucitol operon transcriptional activator
MTAASNWLSPREQIFVLMSAAEADLRSASAACFMSAGIDHFLPDDVRESAKKRHLRDDEAPSEAAESDYGLFVYIDLGQLCTVVNSKKNVFEAGPHSGALEVARDLVTLVKVRNRAFHVRPLEYDDYTRVVEFARHQLSEKKIAWPELTAAHRRLQEPNGFSSAIHVPSFWSDDAPAIPNNLPPPDFNDTGWVGRRRDIENIRKLLAGSYPVISIVGEGGVGKTSLALKVLFDILEDPSGIDQELIVWLSLKSTVFSASGIRKIVESISDATQLFGRLADELGVTEASGSDTALIENLHRYMREFKTLLVIDNLETIGGDTVRSFLENIPLGTKVLITTRVALGQSELSYPLSPFEERDAIHLLRAFATSLNCEQLRKQKTDVLSAYCLQLSKNPLAIKWFVGSVANGKNPQALLNRHSGDYRLLLQFAFTDLYDSLDDVAKLLVKIAFAAGKEMSRAEILLLLESQGLALQSNLIDPSLRKLIISSILRTRLSGTAVQQEKFELGAFAKQYLAQIERPTAEFIRSVSQELTRLRAATDEVERNFNYDRWDFRNVVESSSDEERAARFKVFQALRLVRSRPPDLAGARVMLDAAERLAPAYAEVSRIRAQILVLEEDLWGAREELERCLEIAPESRLGRYSLAYLLIQHLTEYDRAIEICESLVQEFPGETAPIGLLGLALQRSAKLAESAAIYEKALNIINGRADTGAGYSKRRLDTILMNQASETYRRLAELHSRARDYQAFSEHVCRAIEIGWRAIALSGGVGVHASAQQGKNIREALTGVCRSKDAKLAVEVCEAIIRGPSFLDLSNVGVSRNSLLDVCDAGACVAVADRLPVVGEEFVGGDKSRAMTGVIVRVFSDRSFGFLRAQNNEEYYFNFAGVEQDLLSHGINPGARVKFTIGENFHGICALRVDLLIDGS